MHRKLGPLAMMLLMLAIASGCQKQCYICEAELQNAQHLMPAHLEKDPALSCRPAHDTAIAAPADVTAASRAPRPITLQEAIAMALENGTPSPRLLSGAGGVQGGLVDDSLLPFGGSNLNPQSDALRVMALRPALAAASMEESIARFDAQYVTSFTTTTTDALQQGLQSFQNGQNSQYQSSVIKAFADGGVANVSFITNYQQLSSPPSGTFAVFNPLYTAQMQFGYELPLWRDHGVQINQLLNRIPTITGTTMPANAAAGFNNKQLALTQLPGFTGSIVEGILVARLRFDNERAEFERVIQGMVLNVMVAYWRLYQAYGSLYSFEEVMRLSHKAWMVSYAKLHAGAEGGPVEYYPVRAQFEEFRGERMKALGQVIEAERNLRGIIGLPVEDGCRLVPVTPPTLAPFRPDWCASVKDATTLRPELTLARDNVRSAQLNLIAAQNFLKPDVRFVSTYSPIGYGTTITGNGQLTDGTGTVRTDNAFRSLAGMNFNNWTVGLIANVPLGFRLENAAVRNAHLSLAQAHYLLQDQEKRAERAMTLQFQKLQEWYQLIEARNAERKAYTEAVNARIKQVIAGQITPGDIGLLDFQRRLAAAQVKEYESIAEYNSTIARLEWTKGTILQHSNVIIGEGPLPECAQVRAVEHERERTESIILRQRPSPLTHPGRLIGDVPDSLNDPAPGREPQATPDTAAPPEAPAKDNAEVLPIPRQEKQLDLPPRKEVQQPEPSSLPNFQPPEASPTPPAGERLPPAETPPARPNDAPFFGTSTTTEPARMERGSPSENLLPTAPPLEDNILPPAPPPGSGN